VKRLLTTLLAAAGLLVAIAYGGVLAAPERDARVAAPARPGDAVALLQRRLERSPRDVDALAMLGAAYEQRARETGDPAYYLKAERVLARARSLAPDHLATIEGLGSLALSRHDFRKALRLGRRATSLAPAAARGYGVLGDALLELGRYAESFRTFDRMSALKPGLDSYARTGHALDLVGRTRAAERSLRLALEAARGRPEPEAWTHVQLGRLLFSRGRVREASVHHRAALRALPGYAPALDALALAEWAQGRTREAISLERRAVDRNPLPGYVAQLGELYRAAGDERTAREQYALIETMERLLAANGIRTDLEIALIRADDGADPRATVALARRAQLARPSIDGDDVLAWALQRAGRCREARAWSRRALRLGTPDALKLFHRGAIERCLGDQARARSWFRRALELNPRFSVRWSPLAARLAG
jgi:tetratricopeptide (TPR) repeat protein